MIIYMATNRVNGKEYIGQTVGSLVKRKSQHMTATMSHIDNSYFHKAIRKYGIDNFKWKIIHKCNDADFLNRLEIFYIGYYDTFIGNGYNLTLGGGGRFGYKISDETRKKLSIARIGKDSPMYGKKHSAETKRKMSEAQKGKKQSAETRRKISKAGKGRKHSNETKRKMSEAGKGRKHTEESKQKMSIAQSGKNHHMYGKRGKDCPNYGMKHSVETKQKMSIAQSGKNNSMYGRKHSDETCKKISKARDNKYTGKNNPKAIDVIIDGKHFDTLNESAVFLSMTPSAIRYRILHKTKWLGYSYVKIREGKTSGNE